MFSTLLKLVRFKDENMKQVLAVVAFLLITTSSFGQELLPNWYVLEKGASVGILKPGVNDLIAHLGTSKTKQINREEINKVNDKLVYKPGNTILVYADAGNGVFMATDVEGRTLLVKGTVTKAVYGSGCSPAFVQRNIQIANGGMIKYGAYVWVKSIEGDKAVVQYANKQDLAVPMSVLYIVDATAAEMMKDIEMKPVQ